MPSVAELEPQLRELREQQAKFMADNSPAGQLSLTAEQAVEARSRNDAMTAKSKELDDAIAIEQIAHDNSEALKRMNAGDRMTRPVLESSVVNADGAPIDAKTLGELFVESAAYKGWLIDRPQVGPMFELDLGARYGKRAWAQGIKAVFDTVTGWAVQPQRLPDPIVPGYEPKTVSSLLPEGRTGSNAIAYMEETTTTNAAAGVLEGGVKPESGLALTERSSIVRKVATWLAVTDESLEDVPQVESYINTRLRTFVLLEENRQILNGNGTAPNLRGILQTAGILTQALGADSVPDAVYKGITKVRVTSFLEPTGAVFHPNDWQAIRLQRADGATGVYLWGPPSEPGPERIWGLDALVTTSEPENTGLVGAFRAGAQIFRRTELGLQVGWKNDDFIRNQRTIVAEERLALVVFRPSAFCTVTGI